MKWSIRALLALSALGACGKDNQSSSCAKPAVETLPWTDFWQIQFRAPIGTHADRVDGVLPGPGGSGGSPVGERPTITLSKAEPGRFYVQITRTAERTSLEQMKSILLSNHVGSNMQGTPTDGGWDLSYDMSNAATGDASIPKAHIVYTEIAGGYFQCEYADPNCTDLETAAAICRSMRPKPIK